MARIQRQKIKVKFSTLGSPTSPRIRVKPLSINRPKAPNRIQLDNRGRATINLAKLK